MSVFEDAASEFVGANGCLYVQVHVDRRFSLKGTDPRGRLVCGFQNNPFQSAWFPKYIVREGIYIAS